MEIHNFSYTCRTCLDYKSDFKSIFAVDLQENLTYKDMILSLTTVKISEEDGFPQNICICCILELQKAFTFKKLCENSDAVLRNHKGNIIESDIRGEIILIEKEVNESVDNYETNNVETNSDDASEKSVKYEFLDDECKFKEEQVSENEKKKKSYSCDECNEKCLGLASYWKHMAHVHGSLFKCEDCGKRFKTQASLTSHRSTHKTKRKENTRKNKSGIKKTRNLPRTCEICNKTFRFHSNLERHQLIHTGEKPYLCNVCGKGFAQLSYLKIHSFIHTGEKPYKCRLCEKSFAAPGTLMTHTRIHTGERPHVCKICGKDFPQSGYLSAHIRTHTGEKPVECKVCHRRFNQSGRLIIHMRIHSGEKPYACKDCGRSFAVKGTLKKHIRTHTGEKPYICSVCGQAFAQSGTLSTHMKVHKPKV